MSDLGRYKIQSAEELKNRVDAYFKECDEHMAIAYIDPVSFAKTYKHEPQPYTWTGLALHIGLGGRQSLSNYKGVPEFETILKVARLKIQSQWEGKLQRLGNNSGVMFAIINNPVDEGDAYANTQVLNVGGQAGNPVEIKSITGELSEEQLKAMEAILEGRNK